MRQYVAELIGTFFLVLTVGFAVVSGNRLAPVAIGVVLAAAAAAYMFRALNSADA